MTASMTLLFLLCLFLLMPDKEEDARVSAEQDHHYDQLYLEDLYLHGQRDSSIPFD